MSMSLLDVLNAAAAKDSMTKEEFGRVMQTGTKEEKEDALKLMEELGGYENLGD